MDLYKSFPLYLNSFTEKYLYKECIERSLVIFISLHLDQAKVRFTIKYKAILFELFIGELFTPELFHLDILESK